MKVSWDYYSQYMEKYGKYKMFQTTNQFRLDGHMIDIYMTWQHLRWDMAWIFVFMAPGDCLGARSSWPGSCQPIKLGMDYIYMYTTHKFMVMTGGWFMKLC